MHGISFSFHLKADLMTILLIHAIVIHKSINMHENFRKNIQTINVKSFHFLILRKEHKINLDSIGSVLPKGKCFCNFHS